MLSPHLRKFTDIYEKYGLGAVKNLWLLTCILPLSRTVNLYKIKDYVGGLLSKSAIKPGSNYKRLTRFFDDWGGREDFLHDVMKQNLCLLKRLGYKTLMLDGTSWKLGDTHIHYLVLSVLVGPVAVPIYWRQLGKQGLSNQEERTEMMQKVLEIFELKGMVLLADREYIGRKWFKYLKDNKIHFVIRLRLADYESETTGTKGKSYWGMYGKCALKNKIVKKSVQIAERGYTVVMVPNPKVEAEEPVFIFLTTLSDAKGGAMLYAKRWKIECLFKNIKTNGFNIEDMNLKDTGKNTLMLAIVAAAYILAIRVGWKTKDQINNNKYQDGEEWPEVSIFREGLAYLTPICFQFIGFLKFVLKTLSTKNHALFKNVQ